jgi:hypothetical protein
MNIASLTWPTWLSAALLLAGTTTAAEVPKNSGKPAATCVSAAGVLLVKQADGTWKATQVGGAVPSGSLVVGMPRADLVSASGTVHACLLADIAKRGPYPVLETAIVLHDAAGADLDLTFERGLVVLENLKKTGEAKVRVRVGDETWMLTLQTPGAKVGLEIFGRHAPGLPKLGDKKADVPTTDLLLLVIHGQAFLETGLEGQALRAPPGLARMHWDSVLRTPTFQRLEKLPDALMQFLNDRQTQAFKDLCASAATLMHDDLGNRLDDLINSDHQLNRLLGVTLAGAVDDLPRVFRVLMQSSDAATRDQAVLVLRHWLGREPGQLGKLETALVARKKLTEVQARSLGQLLVGFNEEERRDPNTYVALLAYLAHKNQAVRTLAYWHLVRLAPAGREISFDPAAPEDQRRQAVTRWHTLIPAGQLPPQAKAQDK